MKRAWLCSAALLGACLRPVAPSVPDDASAQSMILVITSPNTPEESCDAARAFALAPPFEFAVSIDETARLYVLAYDDTLDTLGLAPGAIPGCGCPGVVSEGCAPSRRRTLPQPARPYALIDGSWVASSDAIAANFTFPGIDALKCASMGGCLDQGAGTPTELLRCPIPCPIDQVTEGPVSTEPTAPAAPIVCPNRPDGCPAPLTNAIDPTCGELGTNTEQFFDEPCAPFGDDCPADGWPDTTMFPGAPIVYVDANAVGGSGTRADPYGSVASALAIAPVGAIIALKRGTYSEPIDITSTDARIVGACTQHTVLSVASGTAVTACERGSTLTNLTIDSPGAFGMLVCEGASVGLERVRFTSAITGLTLQTDAVAALHQVSFAACEMAIAAQRRSSAALEHVSIRGSRIFAVFSSSASLDIDHLLVRDSHVGLSLTESALRGDSIAVSDVDESALYVLGGRADLARFHVERTANGIFSEDAVLTVHGARLSGLRGIGVQLACSTRFCDQQNIIDAVIADHISDAEGIGYAVVAGQGTLAMVTRLSTSDLSTALSVAAISTVTALDVDVTSTSSSSIAILVDNGNLYLERAAIRNAGRAVLAHGMETNVRLTDLSISHAERGVLIEEGASVSAARLAIDTSTIGIDKMNDGLTGVLTLDDLRITGGDSALHAGATRLIFRRGVIERSLVGIVCENASCDLDSVKLDGIRSQAIKVISSFALKLTGVRISGAGDPLLELCPLEGTGDAMLTDTVLRGTNHGTGMLLCDSGLMASGLIISGFSTGVRQTSDTLTADHFWITDTETGFDFSGASLELSFGGFTNTRVGLLHDRGLELDNVFHLVAWPPIEPFRER